MYEERGDARKTTASAASSGVPGRPSGIQSHDVSTWAARATGVAIGPQATTFMRMPWRPYSAATDRARLASAAFAAPYADCCGFATTPVIEPTLTIVPPLPCARKVRIAARAAVAT